ncbi:hypothetical protein MF271_23855 (plasmid) [Deinococcus sp. KNUC1210]|uniref:hypothetical protein n=1 Tax=Deinococcus sp. KNUC1210 TaxID=2917691 RepID=UPI001EF12EB8|nr:hypothetical protein [Deinococcus sp. KNUC1210]ULH17999.1 hypothetical protein MF271_23855 [Deinococcus sp. KNUC1210]
MYQNAGGTARGFTLTDSLPAKLTVLPNSYSAAKGIRWAAGTALTVGAAATPTGTDLTNAAADDQGTLTTTGGTYGQGTLTLKLSGTGLQQNSSGTVCVRTTVN